MSIKRIGFAFYILWLTIVVGITLLFSINKSEAKTEVDKGKLSKELNRLLEKNDDVALSTIDSLLAKAQQTGNKDLIAKAYLLKIKNIEELPEEAELNNAFYQGRNIAFQLNDSLLIASFNYEIGKKYSNTNKHFLAITTLLEGVSYLNIKVNPSLFLKLNYELGVAYLKIYDVADAKELLKMVITNSENSYPNPKLNAKSYEGLAEAYLIEKDYYNAGIFFNKAQSIFQGISTEEKAIKRIEFKLADVQFYSGNYAEAKESFKRSLPFFREQNKLNNAYLALLSIAICEQKTGNTNAFNAFKDSITVFKLNYPSIHKDLETHDKHLQYLQLLGYNAELIRLLQEKNNKLYDEFIDIQNNLSKIVLIQKEIIKKEKESEIDKKSKELNLSLNTLYKEQNIILIAGFLVLISCLIIVLYYLKKQKVLNANLKAKNEIIAEQVAILNHSNKKLEEAIQQKLDIIGVVSHDLKSPVNRLKGLLELAQIDAKKADDYHRLMSLCLIDVQHLIQNLLDNSILDDGKSKLHLEYFDIDKVVEELTESFAALSKHKNIQIKLTDFPTDSIQIYADKYLIIRILENILSNAIKFSPRFSTIIINTNYFDAEKEKIYISILDEGPGFTTEDREKLFKPYVKLSAIPTSGESSTGLGLSIASKLVQLLKGDILLESEPGNGAKFIVVLPVRFKL